MLEKKKILLTFCVCMSFFLCATFGLCATGKKRVILIDPAHGGKDKGVKLTNDVAEKDITLAVARLIKKEFSGEKNMEIVLTRDSDETVDQEERRKSIEKIKPDFLINLHVNGGFGKHASGFELYYPAFDEKDVKEKKTAKDIKLITKNKYQNDSLAMAKLIQENLSNLFPRKGRGLRKADLPITDGMQIPAVVVEMSFATNAEDKEKLLSSQTQVDISKAIAKSIKKYFR